MKSQLVYTLDFDQITMKNLPQVGGKNASLGELFNALKPKGIENLVGCHMHNADQLVPEWQDLKVGDEVWLHPRLHR